MGLEGLAWPNGPWEKRGKTTPILSPACRTTGWRLSISLLSLLLQALGGTLCAFGDDGNECTTYWAWAFFAKNGKIYRVNSTPTVLGNSVHTYVLFRAKILKVVYAVWTITLTIIKEQLVAGKWHKKYTKLVEAREHICSPPCCPKCAEANKENVKSSLLKWSVGFCHFFSKDAFFLVPEIGIIPLVLNSGFR